MSPHIMQLLLCIKRQVMLFYSDTDTICLIVVMNSQAEADPGVLPAGILSAATVGDGYAEVRGTGGEAQCLYQAEISVKYM